jgi:hypothetical protein
MSLKNDLKRWLGVRYGDRLSVGNWPRNVGEWPRVSQI